MTDKSLSGVAINGRFLAQSLSGVQRFATEMTRALAAGWPAGQISAPVVFAPKTEVPIDPALVGGLSVRQVGKRSGQIWEQAELPRAIGNRLLVNLGNTAPLLPPLLGRRQIVVIHDAGVFSTPGSYSRAFRLTYKTMHRALALGRTRIVTVSEFARMDIARHLRIDPARIAVIPEGADHATRVRPDESVLTRNGIAPGSYVLAVGNNAPHKDFPALAHLADMLAARGSRLVISGGFDKRVFQDTGPGLAHATYVGRVSDEELRSLYQHAACFVFPSIYEGFGLPPVEAMACGCPVVARDIPVLREVCGGGALYGAGPQDLTEAVRTLLDDRQQAANVRAAGAERAAVYRWDIAAERFRQIMMQELQA